MGYFIAGNPCIHLSRRRPLFCFQCIWLKAFEVRHVMHCLQRKFSHGIKMLLLLAK